ncbi:unnamed protein product [Lota lota]
MQESLPGVLCGASRCTECSSPVTSRSWSGWETLSKVTRDFHSVLPSDTETSLALRFCLLSVLPCATLNLLPKHATASRIALATTDSQKHPP